MTSEEVCLKFKELREDAGLTMDDVAAELRKAHSTVCNWENGHGRPDIPTFLALCALYGVTDIYATFGQPKPEQDNPSAFGSEAAVLEAYRRADLGTKRVIEKILDVPAPEAKEKRA